MRPVLTSIYDGIREGFGVPARLLKFLDTYDAAVKLVMPTRSVHVHSTVVPWHDWGKTSSLPFGGKPGSMYGYRQSGAYYESTAIMRDDLASIGRTTTMTEWACEIQDVEGLSSSKSDLHEFDTLDAFVEQRAPDYIQDISHDKLQWNLAHDQVRIYRPGNTADHFTRYAWDGRVFLMNHGGSHHFAAARYIASRLGEQVPLRGRFCTHEICNQNIGALRRDFDIFAISSDAEVSNALHDALRSFQATHFIFPLPALYDQARAYLFPRSEPRSNRVAEALRRAGFEDVCGHLTGLCQRQSST